MLRAGAVLGSAQLGLAAAIGRAELPVRRPVRVLILSTGSELVEPGDPLLLGQIYESNSVLLAAAVREAGGEATVLRFVPDDVKAFHDTIAGHLDEVDVLITSGGVSAGAYEVVKDALTGQGVDFVRVAVQPGGPQGSGIVPGPAGGHAARQPGERGAVVRAVPAAGAARRDGSPGHPPADAPRRGSRVELRSPVGAAAVPAWAARRRRPSPRSAGRVRTCSASFAAANCLIEVPEDDRAGRGG